jgi:hypothetical protein
MEAISGFIKKVIPVLLFMPIYSGYSQTSGNVNLPFTIPQVALIDIEPSASSSISFALTVDNESGQPINATGATNNSLWINYSSTFPTGSPNRKVTVQVSSGTIPSGIDITLTPDSYSGTGQGTFGTSAGAVVLSATPKTLISGIGRCYTGNGNTNGHRLNYALSISNYQSLYYNQSATLLIAFTLTDM